MTPLTHVLLGAVIMGDVIAGLFFVRFWKVTGDRFFLFFAASFIGIAVSRVVVDEGVPPFGYEPLGRSGFCPICSSSPAFCIEEHQHKDEPDPLSYGLRACLQGESPVKQLRRIRELTELTILATDGDIGSVQEVYLTIATGRSAIWW